MTDLADLAARATKALRDEASMLARPWIEQRSAVDSMPGDPNEDRDDRMPHQTRRVAVVGWAIGAIVAALLVGAVVSSGPSESPPSADRVSDTAAPPDIDVPVPVAGRMTAPDDWNVVGYYLGGGITLDKVPPGFSAAAEEVGAIERTATGRLLRDTSGTTLRLEARSYIATLSDPRFGTGLTIAYAAGRTPPELAPAVGERIDSTIGDAVVTVAARGFDDDGTVAALVADGVRIDEDRLLDRFDVVGGFDSVLQRSGTAGWVLEQGESSQTRTCVRLIVPDTDVPGGWNTCFEDDRNQMAYALIGDRRFVLGHQVEPQGPFDEVTMQTGPAISLFFEGWTGAVIREIVPGARVSSLDGAARCPYDDIARSLGDPVAFQITSCTGDVASVVLRPGLPDAVAPELEVQRVDGEWVGPAGARPAVYLGGGLVANVLPDEYRRPGGILGGPHTTDAGGTSQSHAVTITSAGFRRTTTVQLGYVADGSIGAPFEGSVVAGRREGGVTLWAASQDHDREELESIVAGLQIVDDRRADDGEAGEFGSVIASGAASRGWTEWTILQGTRTADETCIVLTEKVFGRRPPDAMSVCAPPDAPQSTTLVIRSANTYVIGLGAEGEESSAAVVTLTDGSQIRTNPVRSVDEGQVWVTVVPSGSRVDDVSWTEELGRACTFREMWDRLDDSDGPGPLAVQVAGCELLLATPGDG